jgi:copper chaperone CopZ
MTTTTSFAVIGMTCGHCVSSITRALTDLEGFVSVDVTLVPDGASQVTLISQEPVALPEIATLIDEEGYQVAWS